MYVCLVIAPCFLTLPWKARYNSSMQKLIKAKLLNPVLCVFLIGIFFAACSPQARPRLPETVASAPGSTELTGGEGNADTLTEGSETEIGGSSLTDEELNPDSVSAQIERVNELYEEAVKRWDEGDTDGALAAFDNAYAALVLVTVDDDSPKAEEKSQLRLMIAQRIQGIYASFASIGESSQFIALEENAHVQAEIKRFQTVERQYFMESYARSGLYRGMMAQKMKDAGLPEELSWLPLIESGYKIRAYSSARALGLWQFISSTGQRYGLKKDRWIDERMDPEKATDAAVLYLKELHSYFGDWTTALAAYNCGEFRIQRLIRNQKANYFDNFWDLYVMLPRETARFVPRFMATLMIVKNPQKYQMDLPSLLPPLSHEQVESQMPFKLEQLSRNLSLDVGTLADLNPELRHKSTPDRPYSLKVPQGTSQAAQLAMASLSKWIPTEVETSVHHVRRGDTVSALARRYRTSTEAILRLNNLKKRHTLRIGQRLRIPGRWSAPSRSAVQKKSPQPSGTVPYTVKSGDTLFAIARQFQMSVDQLKRLNQIGAISRIYPGQTLWVVNAGGNG